MKGKRLYMGFKHLAIMFIVVVATMAIVQRVQALANIVYPTKSA